VPAAPPPANGKPPVPARLKRRLALAGAALLLLAGGAGLVYYGDEIPSLWNSDPGGAGHQPGPQVKYVPPALRPIAWKFDRDRAGQVRRIVAPDGRVTRLTYGRDAHKRLRRLIKEFPDETRVVMEFDRNGRRTLLSDAAGKTRFGYDDLGRLTSVRRDGYPALLYAYDTQDRVRSMSLGAKGTVVYTYDFLGRMDRIDTPAGAITYQYSNGSGRVVRTLPGGIRTLWQYHPEGTLDFIEHSRDKKVVARFRYVYRPDGLIREIKEWSPQGEKTISYKYDTVKRLLAVDDARTGTTTRYRYDEFGNRTQVETATQKVASVHDWAGRLTRHNGKECRYDGLGSLTACEPGRFSFTAENLLQSATQNKRKVRYQYDGDGNLVARILGRDRTYYVPDPVSPAWRPLLATDAKGQATLYVWDEGTLLGAITGGQARFFLHDHLGSVRQEVNAQGQLVAAHDYRAFGTPLNKSEDSGLRPGFAGLFYDPAAGLYLARARAYEPGLGRWLQRLPPESLADLSTGFSQYAYCRNDPVNLVDLEGKAPHSCFQQE
jgi:RHS repeat-associated protein